MQIFEWTLALLVAAVALTALARRFGAPYPSMLALLGTALVFIPGAPHLVLEPELALALFVAPVLLDAAFDTSLRDLKRNWRPIATLVFTAVGGTIVAVACTVRWLAPELPWSAAVALGAIVAPPDAAAASAILKQARLPHRLNHILEGESLLNDATALLIYRLAVTTAMGADVQLAYAIPMFAVTIAGSLLAGVCFALLSTRLMSYVEDVPTSVVLQFATTFGVWLFAEHNGLSGILTVVAYAMAISRPTSRTMSARIRVPSYAVWETVVFVLNVLAFVLIGLQLGPILERLSFDERFSFGRIAVVVLAVTIVFRVVWVLLYDSRQRRLLKRRGGTEAQGRILNNGSWLIAWCGMRGIVTLAAALALPETFPGRDLIVLCAFTVVLGTLLIQGLSLKTLLRWLDLRDDGAVEREVLHARETARLTVLERLAGDETPAAQILRFEFEQAHEHAVIELATKRRSTVQISRDALAELRRRGSIGDEAFHVLEEELDRAELFAETNL